MDALATLATKKHAAILAERLGAARAAMDPAVSQRAVARRLGLASATVSLWESGKTQPDIDTIVYLAGWFNTSVEWLYGVGARPAPATLQASDIMPSVPLVALASLERWHLAASRSSVQTRLAYPPGQAVAIQIDGPTPLPGVVAPGDYVVVARDAPITPGAMVMVLPHGTRAPVLRRVVQDGATLFYLADDARWPALAKDACRVVGRVVEVHHGTVFAED